MSKEVCWCLYAFCFHDCLVLFVLICMSSDILRVVPNPSAASSVFLALDQMLHVPAKAI